MASRHPPRADLTYAAACDALAAVLRGDTRRHILDALPIADDIERACERLRAAMRSHVFKTADGDVRLNRIVQSFDQRTQRTGLHVLESWNYREHRFADDIVPVLM